MSMKGCIPSTVLESVFRTEGRGRKFFPAGSQKHKCRMSAFRKLAGKKQRYVQQIVDDQHTRVIFGGVLHGLLYHLAI